MTDLSLTHPANDGFAKRLWRFLLSRRRQHTSAADLETLSDHMRRDIGIERDPLDQMSIRTLHDSMRFSG
jgi:uncharacterized protein YjiS (DUF1127 family)